MAQSLQSRIKCAKTYLAKVKGAVSGQEGSRRTFAICCTLVREKEDEDESHAR